MTFTELQQLCKNKLDIIKLADIARELNVTPQSVSNWKSRNEVPYKYVKELKYIIENSPPISSSPQIKNNFSNEIKIDDEMSLIEIALFLLKLISKNLIILFLTPLIFMCITAFYVVFISKPVYQSEATILPAEGNTNASSKLEGIAMQYGLKGGDGEGDNFTSAKLYPYIIKSRTLLKKLLNRKFDSKTFGSNQTLLKIITYGEGATPKNLDQYIQSGSSKLKNSMINVVNIKQSPLLKIICNAPEPKLAADLTSAVIDELDKIHKGHKLSILNDKKIYIDERMSDILKDLTKQEENLKEFREKNRMISSSPALLLEQERLIRELEVINQVYITLRRESELSKIEEVENSKNLNILDAPEIPINRISPRRTYRVLVSLIFGLIFAFVLIVFKDVMLPTLRQVYYKKI